MYFTCLFDELAIKELSIVTVCMEWDNLTHLHC